MGFMYCPHVMGTALGSTASIHLLAAGGGSGFVELDANENPLRTDLCDMDLEVTAGQIKVPTGTGIGIIPDAASMRRFQVT